MAKITKITTQKKNKHRYNIFLEQGAKEAYAFSVDEDILVEFHLRKGLELDASTIELLQNKDSIHKTYTLALNYLSYRMRSKKEVNDYLTKKEIDSEQIQVVIDKLSEEGFLDDKEFAQALVSTRLHTTSKGPLLVKKELLDKGISFEIVEVALSVYSFDDQLTKARKWVDKKLSQSTKKSFTQQVQSIQQTLMQKGFTQAVIQEVLVDINEEKDEDSEKQAVYYQGEKLLRKYEKKAQGFELKQKLKAALYRKGFDFNYIEQFIREYVEE